MNYRHIYHAGNYADVVKHCVLLLLIEHFKQKDKPFCVLDTHAGLGLYDLQSEMAQKTLEYQDGIDLLLHNPITDSSSLIQNYINIIKKFNPEESITVYPGSPLFTICALRENDELIACELHPDDYSTLRKNIRHHKNVQAHHISGYNGMKAFLPPKQNRGLVLIDPPFEKDTEFDDIISAMKLALKHWRNGMYCIWYPIKHSIKVKHFYNELRTLQHDMLIVEFTLKNNENEIGLASFGLTIINPAWKTHEQLNSLLPYLAEILQCHWKITEVNNA